MFEIVLADGSLPAERRLLVLEELVRMERHTLEGEALDLGWARDGRWDVTSDDYLYMIDGKTAWYTVASPPCPPERSPPAPSPTQCATSSRLGLPAGLAFQLQDDLLNLVGDADAQGKDFRSDITEGKRTLAVVWALEHLGGAERSELVELLESGTADTSGSRGPSSSSSWAAALISVANSPPKRPLKLKSAPASSPNAASLAPRRPSCSFPWRISSSIAARKGPHSAKSIKTFPKTYTYLAFAQDFEK